MRKAAMGKQISGSGQPEGSCNIYIGNVLGKGPKQQRFLAQLLTCYSFTNAGA